MATSIAESEASLGGLFAETRGALQKFYGVNDLSEFGSAVGSGDANNTAASQLERLQTLRKQSAQKQQEVYSVVDMTMKTHSEVISFLSHRDALLQEKAATELARRCTEPSTSQAIQESIKQEGLRKLLTLLSSSSATHTLTHVLHVLAIITQKEDMKDNFRLSGGIKVLIAATIANPIVLSSQPHALSHALTLFLNLSTVEKNQDTLRNERAIEHLVSVLTHYAPGCTSTAPTTPTISPTEITAVTVRVLINLTNHMKGQEELAHKDGLKILMQILTALTQQHHAAGAVSNGSHGELLLLVMKLIGNISNCASIKSSVTDSTINSLFSFLSPKKLYKQENTSPQGNFFVNLTKTSDQEPTNLGGIGGSGDAEEQLQLLVLDILGTLTLHNHPCQVIGPERVQALMTFFQPTKPMPFECFEWNMEILCSVLNLVHHLLQNDKNRQAFTNAHGVHVVVQILIHPDVFAKNVVLTGAAIFSRLASSGLGNMLGSVSISSLIKLLNAFPHNETLQLSVISAFKGLATDEGNRQKIFEEGGVQVLNTLLTQTKTHDLQLVITQTLALLASDKFLRRVIRLVGAIDSLMTLLRSSPEDIQIACVQTLTYLATDKEGVESMLLPVHAPTVVTLLHSKSPEILKLSYPLALVLLRKDEKNLLVSAGVVPALLKHMLSNDEDVQLQVLQMLIEMTTNVVFRDACVEGGIINKIKELAKHPNVTKTDSTLVNSMRTLIYSIKSAQSAPPAPTSPSTSARPYPSSPSSFSSPHVSSPAVGALPPGALPAEVWLRCVYGASGAKMIKIATDANLPDVLKIVETTFQLIPNQFSLTFQDQGHVIAITSKSELQYVIEKSVKSGNSNNAAVEINVVAANAGTNVSKLDSILSQLSTSQLVALVKKLTPTSYIPIKQAILEVIKAEQQRDREDEEDNSSRNNNSNINNNGTSDGTTPINSNNSNNTRSPIARARTDITFVDEIQQLVNSGGFTLRHVDTSVEIEKRKKQNEETIFHSLMNDIARTATTAAQKSNRKILLDQGVIEGKKYFRKDVGRWNEEVQRAFTVHSNMMLFIFAVLEWVEDEVPFGELATKYFQGAAAVSQDTLANTLVQVGFSVKRNHVLITNSEQSTEHVEYPTIIRATDTPVRLILQAILTAVATA